MPNLAAVGKRVKMSMGTPGTEQGEIRTPVSFKGASMEETIES